MFESFDLARDDTGEDGAGDREQLRDLRGGQFVRDRQSLAAGGDQTRAAQDRQLLRQVGGLDADLGEHLGDGMFAHAEQFEHADADRVTESF